MKNDWISNGKGKRTKKTGEEDLLKIDGREFHWLCTVLSTPPDVTVNRSCHYYSLSLSFILPFLTVLVFPSKSFILSFHLSCFCFISRLRLLLFSNISVRLILASNAFLYSLYTVLKQGKKLPELIVHQLVVFFFFFFDNPAALPKLFGKKTSSTISS